MSLRDEDGGGIGFIDDETSTMALLGALLSIIHPDLYDMQLEVLKRLNNNTSQVEVKHHDVMHAALDKWSSPFTGMAVISNRKTPFHRDMKGGKLLYDMVATFGAYKGGRFEVPLLGRRFVYNPGTVFVLPGYLFEHGASRVQGDRVCIAQFIKPNVGYGVYRKYIEISPPTVEHLSQKFGVTIVT